MKNRIWFRCIVFFWISSANLALSSTVFTVKEFCDLPGASLASFQGSDLKTCETHCAQDSRCVAFSFISGWNKCFLKSKAKPMHTVRMYSGSMQWSGAKGEVTESGYDLDHKGKDWQMHDLKDHQACAELCRKHPECLAFTYIEGYRSCWLKKTSGKLTAKKFYCGLKP